jgi:hypothetical protein
MPIESEHFLLVHSRMVHFQLLATQFPVSRQLFFFSIFVSLRNCIGACANRFALWMCVACQSMVNCLCLLLALFGFRLRIASKLSSLFWLLHIRAVVIRSQHDLTLYLRSFFVQKPRSSINSGLAHTPNCNSNRGEFFWMWATRGEFLIKTRH